MKLIFRPLSLAIALCSASAMSFADTLSDVYELALKNDATLKAAEASYRANVEQEKQALSSMLPQINAEAFSRSSNQESTFVGVPTTSRDNDSDGYTLSLSQKIFDLSAWFNFKSGKEITQQAQAQLAFDQQDLIIRVANAYFNVLRALDNLEASKAEERASIRQLEQTRQRFDVGLIAITDVHEAKAVYDSTVVQRLTDEGTLGTSYETLTILSGQAHANLWLLNKDFPVTRPDPVERNKWVEFALHNNFSLKAALHGMQASKQIATAKKMEHLPKIEGRFVYTEQSNSGTDNQFNNVPANFDNESESLQISLTVPLFAGGRISSQRRQAYEQYNVALQQKINTQRNVVQNTRASHITVSTDVQRVRARSQAIISTKSALDATQAGYEVGTRNIVDVLQAQRRLYSSIRDYANSRYDYVINMLKLKQAAGILSPKDIYDINKWIVEPGAPSANQYKKFLNP